MNNYQMRAILKLARKDSDIDYIKCNVEELYDYADMVRHFMELRLSLVNQRRLQKLGLYAWLDGFAIYCPKDYPENTFALGKFVESKVNIEETVHSVEEIEWSDDLSFKDLEC